MLVAFLAAAFPLAAVWDCTDAGPWSCSEHGCPEPALSCDALSALEVCDRGFDEVWENPPSDTGGTLVRELCPRACGLCGISAPVECNMPRVDASTLSTEALARLLLSANTPVLVLDFAQPSTQVTQQLVDERSRLPVRVIVEGGRYRDEQQLERTMTMGEFAASMRNGSIADQSYVFHELGGVDASSGELKLGGVDVDTRSRALLHNLPRYTALLARVLLLQNAERLAVAQPTDGRVLLSAGSWGNGRPFHLHGPALFLMLRGEKHWLVRRPNASLAWQTFEPPRQDLATSSRLSAGGHAHLWSCAQAEGELLWVPDMLQHATVNHAAETVGLTMVMDVVAPLSPLHEAAQAGNLDEVRRILAASAPLDGAAANGGTPLHYASAMGHTNVISALLEAGADADVRARQGLTPLHMAAAGGHIDAVDQLLKSGARGNEPSQYGLTPLDIALQLGRHEVARVLQNTAKQSKQSGRDEL